MATSYFNRTLGTSTSRRIFTMSTWVKRCLLSNYAHIFSFGPNPGDFNYLRFNNSNQLNVGLGGDTYVLTTNALYRDTSAWYHVMTAIDTTQATSSNRVKLYVNGEQVTSFSSASYPTQNLDTNFTSGVTMRIGSSTWGTNELIEGNLASTYLIDGQALTPSSFGETDATTGIWKPKSYSGSYGTNGFFLKFENSASLGTDSSGNGNNFTVNGTPTQTVDTPSNVFCTFNAVVAPYSAPTLSNGNTTTTNNSADYDAAFGTIAVSKGKWYWELKKTDTSAAHNDGVFDVDANSFGVLNPMNVSTGYTGFYNTSGGQMRSNNATSGSYGTFSNNDIMGIALDMDNKLISIYKNGTIHVSNFTISTGCLNVVPTAIYYETGSSQYNFGNGRFGTTAISSPYSDGAGLGKFQYQPPTGYYALCTKNINVYG
jgi:hypothetical protein